MNKKNTCFPNQTISDELLRDMTYDDMMLTIYHCQRGCFRVDRDLSEQKIKNVCYQLLRILLRISGRVNITLPDLLREVIEGEERDRV